MPNASPPLLRRAWIQALLIAFCSLALIVQCWDAGFTNYDDSVHVSENPHLARGVSELFKPKVSSTYFPVTEISYQLDHALFSGWMPARLGSWAPGVRCMTLLYHVLAALILWRLLRRLLDPSPSSPPPQGDGESGAWDAAFFIALVFAVHPLACETVCWTSERKNALAGLFGFAALWAWLAGSGRLWRMPAVAGLYALALLSKPSALGLLPVFFLLELFGGAEGIARGGRMFWRPSREWIPIAARMVPLSVLAGIAIAVNLKGHAVTIVPPPGGSVFTAALTDLEILPRYIVNLLFPARLSAAYFVLPVWRNQQTGQLVIEGRVFAWGLLLAAVIGSSVYAAASRRRAMLGWLWFVGALGPNLNFIAIPHLMQDRYLYLSAPGFFLVVCEVAAGLRLRFPAAVTTARARAAAALFVILLMALAAQRSGVWVSMLRIFADAAAKQPQALFARYGLGSSYAQAWEDARKNPRVDRTRLNAMRSHWMAEWQKGIDACPDAGRYACYLDMALSVGEHYSQLGDLARAEHYWTIASRRPREAADDPGLRGLALGYLATLRMEQGRAEDAYSKAVNAAALRADEPTLLICARAGMKLAAARQQSGDETGARELLEEARARLNTIAAGSASRAKADELLRDPIFQH